MEAALPSLVDRAHRMVLGARSTAGLQVADLWDRYGGVNAAALDEFAPAAVEAVAAMQDVTVTVIDAYLGQTVELLDPATPSDPLAGEIDVSSLRGGTEPLAVYARPVITARTALAAGKTWAQAMAEARARAVSAAETDVMLAQRATMDAWVEAERVAGYRRVLTGRSCMYCATASTQRYRRGELMPLHSHCDCGVAPILGSHDPGHVVNRRLLRQLKQAGGSSYWKSSGYVAEHADGGFVVDVAGKHQQLEVAVHQHGELGPVLGNAAHHFDTAA